MWQNNNNQFNMLDRLAVLANILQVASYQLNLTQTSNDELMKALEEQNEKYLETAIQQNKEIIARLERLESKNNVK